MQPENYEDLWKWFGFINDLFFGRLLKGFCRIEFLDRSKWMEKRLNFAPSGYEHTSLPGRERDIRYKLAQPVSLIVLRKMRFVGKTPLDSIAHYLSNLCHEMLHSLFSIFVCACRSCTRMRGVSHDIHWQAAALAIERISGLNSVFGWRLDINRAASAASDVVRGRADLPNDAALRELELDIEIVKSILKGKLEGASKKRGSPIKKTLKSNSCIREEWIEL